MCGGGEGVKVQPEESWLLKICFQACALSLAALRALFRFQRSAGSLSVGRLCLWRVKEWRLSGEGLESASLSLLLLPAEEGTPCFLWTLLRRLG